MFHTKNEGCTCTIIHLIFQLKPLKWLLSQAAVAAQSTIVHELKDTPPAPKVQVSCLIDRLFTLVYTLGLAMK